MILLRTRQELWFAQEDVIGTRMDSGDEAGLNAETLDTGTVHGRVTPGEREPVSYGRSYDQLLA